MSSLSVGFPDCKLGIIMVPTLEGYQGSGIRKAMHKNA